MDMQIARSDAELWYEFDWAFLPSGVYLQSVVHTVPSPLQKLDEGSVPETARSSVKVTGGVHGGLYPIKAVATLSNGESLPWTFDLRIFN